MTPLPNGPWEQVSIDFCEVSGHYLLVVIDDFSRFPEVEVVHSTSAKTVIPKLDRIFAAYGIPKVVKTDNGPLFNGYDFTQFSKYLGFKHRKVTPLWPEANGEVERFMRTLGKMLRTTKDWKQNMYQFLRNYRATPHCTTGIAPATVLFGRPIRIKLPCPVVLPGHPGFDPVAMHQHDTEQKQKIKAHAESRRNIKACDIQVGDMVLVKQPKRHKLSTPYHPVPLKVTKKIHDMMTAVNSDRQVTRNSSYFKKMLTDELVSADHTSANLDQTDQTNQPSDETQAPQSTAPVPDAEPASPEPTKPILRRSSQISKPP